MTILSGQLAVGGLQIDFPKLQNMALFRITDIFSISGRGDAVIGNILQGELAKGDVIQLPDAGVFYELKIRSVEEVRKIEDQSAIVLILSYLTQQEKSVLEFFRKGIVQVLTVGEI